LGIWAAVVSKDNLLAVDASTLLTPIEKFAPGRLVIRSGSIADVGPPEKVIVPAGAEKIDASGFCVVPGFIDPHIHGCGGVDTMDATRDSLNAMSRIVARHGTTCFLPTTVSSPPEVLTHAVERIGALLAEPFDGAAPVGIHLEGPFISVAKRGTHKAANVLDPNIEQLQHWVEASRNSIRLLTVAPELPGIDALLIMAKHLGLTVAMGHSNATFEQAQAAAHRGACYAVHTFNAMRAFSHRDPGIVGEVLADDRIFAEIIADGIHVDNAVIQTFARAKRKDRVLLVTDAISATDMPDGPYRIGSDLVNVVNGVCRDGQGRLAGSTLTQEIALRNFVDWTNWSLDDALLGVTLNVARALQLERKGILAPGADADFAVLDDHFRVLKTFVAGRCVFDRGKSGTGESM
jgi:N-acetylglucosamine-6-phosphate deacetylase